MKEIADEKHWGSESHSIIETSIPISEEPGIKHIYTSYTYTSTEKQTWGVLD